MSYVRYQVDVEDVRSGKLTSARTSLNCALHYSLGQDSTKLRFFFGNKRQTGTTVDICNLCHLTCKGQAFW